MKISVWILNFLLIIVASILFWFSNLTDMEILRASGTELNVVFFLLMLGLTVTFFFVSMVVNGMAVKSFIVWDKKDKILPFRRIWIQRTDIPALIYIKCFGYLLLVCILGWTVFGILRMNIYAVLMGVACLFIVGIYLLSYSAIFMQKKIYNHTD